MKYIRLTFVVVVTLGLSLSLSYAAQQSKTAPPAGKKEHVFKGKVEKIDLADKKLVVNGEKVEGWMDQMTMSYSPDKEDILKKVKVGDQITAKVYDGDFRVLHDVQVVDAKTAEPKSAPAVKDTKKDPAKK
jgi:Cu/Ag efflux protein CusF